MLTVQTGCGLVTTNGGEVIQKVNAKFYVPFYTFILFGRPGACFIESSGNHWSENAVFQISMALKFKQWKI